MSEQTMWAVIAPNDGRRVFVVDYDHDGAWRRAGRLLHASPDEMREIGMIAVRVRITEAQDA